jgi:hypothetical protein
MRFAARRRRWLAVWLVGVLLFAQLATAAHACPAWFEQARDAIAMAAMPGCEHAAAGAPASELSPLCKSHCSPDAQSSSPAPSADLHAHPVLLAVLDWTPTAQRPARPGGCASVVRSGAPPPGSPPLYLSLLVLRN